MLIRVLTGTLFLAIFAPHVVSQQTERDLSICRDNLATAVSQYKNVQSELDRKQEQLRACTERLRKVEADLQACSQEPRLLPEEKEALQNEVARLQNSKQ